MQGFLGDAYLWTKSFHLVSVVAWMAGLLYLPRLFVYHSNNLKIGSELSETLKVMEKRLLRFIMNPAMMFTWFFGLVLVFTPGVVDLSSDIWFYVKLIMILAMTWFHHWLGKRRKEFLTDTNTRSPKTYRMMNEVPTVLMVIIVITVIVKPF